MKRVVFDIEANGLLGEPWRQTWGKNPPPTATQVHCICLSEVGSGLVRTYTAYEDGYPSIEEALKILDEAETIIGHNIIRYDIPMLEKFYGWQAPDIRSGKIRDTLVMSKMGYTALREKDKRVAWRNPAFPRGETGKHSLRAWGYRIGKHKGHVNDTEDFSVCDEEMLRYCERDVEVNNTLFRVFESSWALEIDDAVQMEHEFFYWLERMTEAGWALDTEHARDFIIRLQAEKEELDAALFDLFPPVTLPPSNVAPWEEGNRWWSPKALKTKEKTYAFNPASAAQVIWNLNKKYGWTPKRFTDKGNPVLNDEVLSSLEFPEAKQLTRVAMISKRLSSLVGKSGYITLLGDDGRLHGEIDHCGAVSHRCTHRRPNQANATGNGAEYGEDIRKCFTVPKGYKLVGADASALELCMLANRMAKYDGGSYAETVVSGDPHTRNWQAASLDEWIAQEPGESEADWHKRIRNQYGKRMTYGLMYGAGDQKLGSIVEPPGAQWDKNAKIRAGKKVRAALYAGLPALKQVIEDLQAGFRPGQTIEGLDGRVAENRSKHQALNTQLQMDGAVVMKWATVLVHRWALDKGWAWGPAADWCMVGHIHDEFQFQVREDIAVEFGQIATRAITEAGRMLSVLCRLDGDYSIGQTWADTH